LEFVTGGVKFWLTNLPKFDANGVDDAGPLFIDFSTRKLRAKYNETLQVNASKELCTTFNCVGLKTGI